MPPWRITPVTGPGLARRPGEPTARQLEVFAWAAAGLRHQQIGRELGIRQESVSTHLRRLAATWHTRTRYGTAGVAFRRGWLTPTHPVSAALSDQQADVLSLLAADERFGAIGEYFSYCPRTVHSIVRSAVTELGAANTLHAVALWAASGTVRPHGPLVRRGDLPEDSAVLLARVAAGDAPAQIAELLSVPRWQVYERVAQLREYARVRNSLALIGWGYRTGLLVPRGAGPAPELPDLVVTALAALAGGASVPGLAIELHMSEYRIWRLLALARRVLGACSRLELVVAAYETGVLAVGGV